MNFTLHTRRLVTSLALLVSAAFWPSVALGAAPANDDFADAVTLVGLPVSATGTNVEASEEVGEPSHEWTAVGQSLWYTWQAPSASVVTVGTCGSDFDTVLAVYAGSDLKALKSVARNNWSRGPNCEWTRQAEVTFEAKAGTTYWIAVDGAFEEEWEEEEFEGGGPDPEGEIQLSISATPPPANDAFAHAEALGFFAEEGVYFGGGFNWAATKEAGEPGHAGDPGGASVWYAWTAPRAGTVIAHTCYSAIDTLLAVYTGNAVNALTPVAVSPDSAFSPRQV